jgi:phospholipase/carboxylesterase
MVRIETLGLLEARFVGDPALERCVVLLHGFGAPGDDLVGLAGQISVNTPCQFVFPAAPIRLPLGMYNARAWWMFDFPKLESQLRQGRLDDLVNEPSPGLDEASAKLRGFLAALASRYSLRPQDIVLGGFSQGSMVACDAFLRSEARYAGLVLLSGAPMHESEWMRLALERGPFPVFQSHGEGDPVLPFVLGERLVRGLERAGCTPEFAVFPGGHGIPSEVLRALGPAIDAMWG